MTTIQALINGRWYEIKHVEQKELDTIITKLEKSVNVFVLSRDETTAVNIAKADVIKFVDEKHIDVRV